MSFTNALLSLIAFLIAIVGYFIRKEIHTFGKRLDRHEALILTMTGTVQRVVGEVGILVRLFKPIR